MLLGGTAGCLFYTVMLIVCSALWGGTGNKIGNGFGVSFIFLHLTFRGHNLCFFLFGQFVATIILLETAQVGFVNVGWKGYFVIITWFPISMLLMYFFWPEIAKLSLEEISAKFGDDVAIGITGASTEERLKLDVFLKNSNIVHDGVTGTSGNTVLEGEKSQFEVV